MEGICSGLADFAWFGPVTYLQAKDKGCVELLAVEVRKGSSVYYSGIFTNNSNLSINNLNDLYGKKIAFGDINSTSSFVFPMAMLVESGINPIIDLSKSQLTGSHANSLKALQAGIVDAAAASFNSYEKAVRQGSIIANEFKIIAKSDPIPNPPLAMSVNLPKIVKDTIGERESLRALPLKGKAGHRLPKRHSTPLCQWCITETPPRHTSETRKSNWIHS